jgi:hypothetical protein
MIAQVGQWTIQVTRGEKYKHLLMLNESESYAYDALIWCMVLPNKKN